MTNAAELDKLKEIVVTAAKQVVDPYFKLPVAGGTPVLRERVYAYELFHQLRLQADGGVTLTAEPDKRGHPKIDDDSNPDFVFHEPGTMGRNLVVLEVKRASSEDVGSDLKKFKAYLDDHDYSYCLWLVFGPLDEALFKTRFADPFKEFRERGRLLWHRSSGSAPEVR